MFSETFNIIHKATRLKESDSYDLLEELIDELSDIEVTLTKDKDSFNKKGDEISFTGQRENHGSGLHNTYLRGTSTNREVGNDIWSLGWIIDGFESHYLTTGDRRKDLELVEMYRELEEASEYEED